MSDGTAPHTSECLSRFGIAEGVRIAAFISSTTINTANNPQASNLRTPISRTDGAHPRIGTPPTACLANTSSAPSRRTGTLRPAHWQRPEASLSISPLPAPASCPLPNGRASHVSRRPGRGMVLQEQGRAGQGNQVTMGGGSSHITSSCRCCSAVREPRILPTRPSISGGGPFSCSSVFSSACRVSLSSRWTPTRRVVLLIVPSLSWATVRDTRLLALPPPPTLDRGLPLRSSPASSPIHLQQHYVCTPPPTDFLRPPSLSAACAAPPRHRCDDRSRRALTASPPHLEPVDVETLPAPGRHRDLAGASNPLPQFQFLPTAALLGRGDALDLTVGYYPRPAQRFWRPLPSMPGILPMKVIKVGANAQTRIAQACDR